ncbi:uncharacterized protein B0J16DRAFT_343069 [Fusarium flagelliforme]|uniref:uncharacterized protein n=1 Tax=Fusarium flagelliforme TaxID=2675880 RepID=UPI001E8EA206|nr:uncharacterized protein B0J16DRAFT_343069 [Fusarium flagelliforme]KAH7185983.1 hypothetical protein B0J16DRAFT_343069 [Fusarium flagelliforme]
MHPSTIFTFSLLNTLTSACSFHNTEDPRSIFNSRRSPPNLSTRTAIHDIRIFNGRTFTPRQTICLDNGLITSLTSCPHAPVQINSTGKFLLPGLFDSHVHLTDIHSLEDFTSYGCTTAMHMNCQNLTQCDILTSQEGQGLASVKRAGRSSVGINSLHAKNQPLRPKGEFTYPNTSGKAFVEWQFGNGSDFHKITAEVNGPTLEQQIDMVKTAHREFGKQTMTHAADVFAYQQAITSRTDGIQHVPDDGLLSDTMIRRIKAQKQFVTPTLNVYEFGFRDPVLQKYFNIQANSNRSIYHAETNARLLYNAGVPLILGTDSIGTMTMNGSSVTVPFGLSVHFEMQNLVNIVGMSPAEAINAATREAAKWHQLSDRGTIEVGKRADLLMLGSDPLVDITNTLDIERVWVYGAEVARVTKGDGNEMDNPACTTA